MNQEQNTQQPQQEQNTPQKPQTIIVKSTKNVGLAAGLGFFFGPLGMC